MKVWHHTETLYVAYITFSVAETALFYDSIRIINYRPFRVIILAEHMETEGETS
jgi:hypothetical protein